MTSEYHFRIALAIRLGPLARAKSSCHGRRRKGGRRTATAVGFGRGAGDTRMLFVLFGLLIGLEIKHFVADYLLQPAWMVANKRDWRHAAGYVHAAIHSGLTLLVLLAVGTPVPLAPGLAAGEFAIHFGLDFAKAHYSEGVRSASRPGLYWAQHGLDQLLHQLTYVGIIFIVLRAAGLV
jgi:hypothetical protein